MDSQTTPQEPELEDDGRRRRDFVRGGFSLGGAIALASTASAAPKDDGWAKHRRTGGKLLVRWLGGGVVEIATPDYKQIAYGDAWIWNNAGWDRFGVKKPPEYASAAGFAAYVAGKKPEAVFVLLTHDHGDHMGDYFEMLKALSDAGVPVKTTGQSDMMRSNTGLVPEFRKAGLDPAKIVVNGGAGMNFGGVSRHGEMTAHLIPALHSNLCGYPAAGFILEIGGVRVYLSGDTDLFGDMRMLGERYKPDLGIVCVGGGPFTMGPQDAARASAWVGVSHAIPVHYAHNGLVLGVEAGEQYRQAASHAAPSLKVSVMKPGEQRLIAI
jgi:L-ascorbate metabolism protein UlaG (beta-lactamase superfamily)